MLKLFRLLPLLFLSHAFAQDVTGLVAPPGGSGGGGGSPGGSAGQLQFNNTTFGGSSAITCTSSACTGVAVDLTQNTNKIPLSLRFEPLGWLSPVLSAANTAPAPVGPTENRDPVVSVQSSALYFFFSHGANSPGFQLGVAKTSNGDTRFDPTYAGIIIPFGGTGSTYQCGAFSPAPPYQDGSSTWHLEVTAVRDVAANSCAAFAWEGDTPWSIADFTASSIDGPWTYVGLSVNGATDGNTLDPWVVPASISSSGLYEMYVSQNVSSHRQVVQYTSTTGLQSSWTRVGVVFDPWVNYTGSPWLNNNPVTASTGVGIGGRYTIATLGSTNFTTCGAASNTVGTSFTSTVTVGNCTGNGTAYPWDDVENPAVFKFGNLWYMTVDDSEDSLSHAAISTSGSTCCTSFVEQDGGTLAGNNNGNNAANPWDSSGTDALGPFLINNQWFAAYQGIGPNGGSIGVASIGRNFERQPVILNNAPALNSLTVTPIAQPAQPALTAFGGTGTTWGYAVVCFAPDGTNTLTSGTATISGGATLSSTVYNQIRVSAAPGAAYCEVYRRVAGGTPSTTGKISYHVSPYADNGSYTVFIDNGQAGDGTEPLTTYAVQDTGAVAESSQVALSAGRAYLTGTASDTWATGIDSNYESANTAAGAFTVTLDKPALDGQIIKGCFKNTTGLITWRPTSPATAVQGLPTGIAGGQCVEMVYNAVAGTPTNSPATTWVLHGSGSAPRYDIAGMMLGTQSSASQLILRWEADRPVYCGTTGSVASAGTAATGSTTFTINKNGSQVGTAVWSASGTTATVTISSAFSLASTDVITEVGPASADATLANVSITLACTA